MPATVCGPAVGLETDEEKDRVSEADAGLLGREIALGVGGVDETQVYRQRETEERDRERRIAGRGGLEKAAGAVRRCCARHAARMPAITVVAETDESSYRHRRIRSNG